jgi:hypothetical protein
MVQKSDSGTPPEGPRDPFAPPPKDAPDRPWQPRQPRQHPARPGERGWANENPPQHSGQDDGNGRDGGNGDSGGSNGSHGDGGGQPQRPVVPPPHPWSPGYQGAPPRLGYGPPQPQGPRFDPTDPVQRRARYALLSGMWGIFFLILDLPYVTLALAALALYWSISSLRGTAKTPVSALTSGSSAPGAAAGAGQAAGPVSGAQGGPVGPPPPPPGYAQGYVPPPYATKPQLPAALGGLVASIVGLSLVAAVFGVQMYYKSYYDCHANALTRSVYQQCADTVHPKPPEWLKQLNGDT